MEWILYIVALLFVVVGAAGVFAVILGLPGSWMILAFAIVIELLDGLYLPEGDRQTFAWWLIIACALFAGLGEFLEFIAGMLGAKSGGSSKRGMWGALVGGMIGAVAGFAIPAPVVGSLIGAAIGAFVGAIWGELSHPDRTIRDVRGTIRPATGAAVGRVLGTLSKLPIAVTIWLALSVAAFWP